MTARLGCGSDWAAPARPMTLHCDQHQDELRGSLSFRTRSGPTAVSWQRHLPWHGRRRRSDPAALRSPGLSRPRRRRFSLEAEVSGSGIISCAAAAATSSSERGNVTARECASLPGHKSPPEVPGEGSLAVDQRPMVTAYGVLIAETCIA